MRRTGLTTRFERGDVVLVNFLFSEQIGAKRRPAVVVSSEAYHRSRGDTIIAAVTSNVGRILLGDYLLSGWREAGLLYPSVVTGIIRTVKQSMIARRLGRLQSPDLVAVNSRLTQSLGLGP